MIRRLLTTLLAITAGLAVASVPASAAGPRPLFQLPFACGESWRLTTYEGHDDYDIDMAANSGTTNGRPILASFAGTVSAAGWNNGGGWYVKIDHGSGWETLYLHMIESPMVHVGQVVDRQQQLGRVGSTGDSSGPHLHYEQRADGRKVESHFNGLPSGITSDGDAETGPIYEDTPVSPPVNVVSRNCGGNRLSAGPAVHNPHNGNIEVYFNSGGILTEKFWSPTSGWSGGTLNAPITSRPTAIHNPNNGNIEVYFNSGGVLKERYWSPSSGWQPLSSLDAPITGSPAVIHNPNNGNIEVYFNSGNVLTEKYWSPTSGWAGGTLNAPITGNPTVIHNPNNGNIQVYFNSGNVLTEKYWSPTSSWGGGSLNVAITGDPWAIHNPNNGNIEVYFNSGGILTEKYWSPTSGWSAVGSLQVPISE